MEYAKSVFGGWNPDGYSSKATEGKQIHFMINNLVHVIWQAGVLTI